MATSPSSPLFNNVLPAPRPSLSESALPSRRIILRTNNKSPLTNNVPITSSSMVVRPSRFVKPTPSSSNSLTTSANNNDMTLFVQLFDEYSQKVYMEGYLMHQGKKYFVELCGMTLALWDIDRPGNVVTPDYIPIMVDTKASPTTQRQQFTLELAHKKKSMVFDTLDPASLTKWICAVHLACFERHCLDQYFTLHLFTSSPCPDPSAASSGPLQVLLPNNKNEWKKRWVVVTGDNDKKQMAPRLAILESKKSKTALLELKRVDHAYAVYPESASLISKSTLVRLEGIQDNDQPVDVLLMADTTQHMTQWLSTLYNAFKLYGRPHSLVQDALDPIALNFGQILPNNDEPCWWLETEDIIHEMETLTSPTTTKMEIRQRLIHALQQKQLKSPIQQQPYAQQRANSLPLITVESMDPPRQRATSDAGILNDPSIRPALHSQVADSSDESDGDLGEDDDEEEEVDSDDEPIGKSKPMVSQHSSKKAASSLLIPDFDFGNGFDTDRRTSTPSSVLLSGRSSPTTSDVMSRSSSRQQSRSTPKLKTNTSTTTDKKQASSSLFGDFSLTTDFNKYLEPTPSRTSTPDRKYSLSPNIKLGHERSGTPTSTHGMERRASSWDDYRLGWDDHAGGRYMNEDYLYQYSDDDDDNHNDDTKDDASDDLVDESPMIPSLNDHFAPRNSLLDSHAGEQLSAKEQIEYARATGQPLIQMPSKPRPPKGGLVGVISQREKHRRQGKGTRVAERVNQHHADLLEREKERRILEQRQQQYMKHQIMMYAQNGYVHPMHPYMTGPSPNNVLGSPTMGSPAGSPYASPMPSSNGYFYGRPYSPSGNSYFSGGGGGAASTMYPSAPSSPHQPFIHIGSNNSGSGSSGGGSVGRRSSRPLLSEEEDEDEPLCSPLMAYQFQQQQQQHSRTASPTFYHKMQPVPSSSTGTSSLRL